VSDKLKDIKAPVSKELEEFEKKFRESMRSSVPLLDRITYYIVQRKGKQMRPLFVLLSARLFNQISEATYIAASLVELLHTATLVHDDVVDDAYERRGFFSINALWKNKIAVLVGDYLLSKGLLLSIEHDQIHLLKILSNAVKEMSEGELLQIEKARKLDIEESVYFDIIRQKTASLIASACASGAASAGASVDEIERMRLLGEKIGIAFQIKDDLFDFGNGSIGKPTGIDIKEKKMTLPLIYALQNAPKSEKRKIINTIKNHSTNKAKVAEVIQFVNASGGIEYAHKAMVAYRKEAIDLLMQFPESDSRNSIEMLIAYTIDRLN